MVFRFGQVELDESAYELRRDGQVQHLEPKVLDLLLFLVHHRDRLVTKSEILDHVWSDVVVSESALTRAVSLVRAAIGDSARGQSMIETVSGRGYRFRAAVDTGPVDGGLPATPLVVAPRRARAARLRYAVAVVLVLLVGVWLTWPAALGLYLDALGLADPPEHPPLPDRPSIAVLPFTDLGPAHDRAYVAEGIADEVTVGLARFRELFVIARSSAFVYRGPAVDLKRVGRELGVRYIVDGSLRASQDEAILSAQLVDATTGFQLWSGRYERRLDDVFDLQTTIATEILHALGLSIADAEIERVGGRDKASSTPYTAYALAQMHWYRFTREDNRKAEEILDRALALDPGDPRSHALLASTHLAAYALGWEPTSARLDRGRALALRAIELDPLSARAYTSLAAADLWLGRRAEALASARRAVELGPNSDLCFGVHASALAADGRIYEAIGALNKALRLNPRHPSLYWMLLGYLHQGAGRDERAATVWERVRQVNPDMIPPRVELLRYYDAQGRSDDSRTMAREILRINPDFTAEIALRLDQRPRSTDAIERFRAQLQRAGIR